MKSNINHTQSITFYWTFENGKDKVYRVISKVNPEIYQFALKFFRRPATQFGTFRMDEWEACQLVSALELLGFTVKMGDRIPLSTYKWQKGE